MENIYHTASVTFKNNWGYAEEVKKGKKG